MIVCGVMTGTSVDGIDIAICRFGGNSSCSDDFELLAYQTCDLDSDIQAQIQQVISNEQASIKDLSQLNFAYTRAIADAIENLCLLKEIKLAHLDLIACHGQTIWHNPTPEIFGETMVSSTYQMLSPNALSAWLGKKVVSDFRSADVALGGEGSPLVPVFDYYFFRDDKENRILLNIGGIANMTIIPANAQIDDVIAFDVGAGNCLIDLAAKYFYDQKYDFAGNYARNGNINHNLMEHLKKIDFVQNRPPKSTGRDLFSRKLIENFLNENHNPDDILRTLTEFTVDSIILNLKKHSGLSRGNLIISGGGARNVYLVELLKEKLSKSFALSFSDDYQIPIDAKEAIAFAYLGYRRANSLHGNLPNVTGASRKALLGSISEA